MGTMVRRLAAAEEAGAVIHIDQAVEQILVEGGRVTGVRLANGRELRSRVVLSYLDPKRTSLQLLAPEHREPGWPARAPVISFSVPSAVYPTLEPAGAHTASAWIFSAPARLRGGSWDDVREPVAERLIDQITASAPNFRRSVLHYRLRTPLDLERENGLTDGCIGRLQHGGEQLFWNRPLPELARYRAPLPGLYLCGAGQHPGGEVTGPPGHNAAQTVLYDW
jgi:phytoene dehydrogenase-like protein